MWDGAYSNLLTTEIYARAAFVLIHPFRTAFRVTPKDGIDEGGWAAVRQLRLIIVVGLVLAAAVVARCLALAGIIPLAPLPGLAVVAGLGFALFEMVVVTLVVLRVSGRRQARRHYRVPVEVAGVIGDTVVRVVDLTPGGAGIIGPRPLEVGAEIPLHLSLPTIDGDMRDVGLRFAVCSTRPAREWGGGWEARSPPSPRWTVRL